MNSRSKKNEQPEKENMVAAVAALAKEKNISKEVLFSAIEEALKSAYKNNFSKEYGMPSAMITQSPVPNPCGTR